MAEAGRHLGGLANDRFPPIAEIQLAAIRRKPHAAKSGVVTFLPVEIFVERRYLFCWKSPY